MKQLTLLCAMALLSFMACQKENASTSIPIVSTENYFPLKVGNYWIYNSSFVDQDGVETTAKELDSVYLEKDTLINGKTYFKMVSSCTVSNCFSTRFIKDSLHYIVDEKGVKLFSSENFTDTLHVLDNKGFEGILKSRFYKMEKEDNVQVPIGTYNCLDYRMKGILVQPIKGKSERFCHTYYAKNIGIIRNTATYISDGAFIKEDLIRYKIQ